jgi:acylphosphatase
MIRAELLVRGAVQKVGYRDYVQEAARGLGVKGFVENLRDGSVRIVCEAEERIIDEFIKLVDVEKDLIAVGSIEVVGREPAVGEFEYFDIKYGPLEEELGERLVAAYKIAVATREEVKASREDIGGLREETREGFKGLREDIGAMHSDLKGEIGAMHSDLKGEIGAMHSDLKGEIGGMREDLKGEIGAMHSDLKGEIVGVGEGIRGMHVDMNRNFAEMAGRYDVISDRLGEAVEAMKRELAETRGGLSRAVDRLSALVEEFIRQRRTAGGSGP